MHTLVATTQSYLNVFKVFLFTVLSASRPLTSDDTVIGECGAKPGDTYS
jgi:hypothetical protein